MHSQTKEKIPKQSETEQQNTGAASKKMASCRLSSEIEGVKNRISPVQQKSKIPVRRVPRLENKSGKRSSSEDEVNMMQRNLRNRVEKSQNKPPSRIRIPIGRASSKDVGRDKIPKNVIAATGKKPLGRDSGIVTIIVIVLKAFGLNWRRQKFQPNWAALFTNYGGTFNICLLA